MNSTDDTSLAADIEAATREVLGVADVYRASRSKMSHIIEAGSQLLGVRDEDAPLVTVVRGTRAGAAKGKGSLQIEISVSMYADRSAAESAGRIHQSITSLLASRGEPDADIHITVVHLDESTQ